jgi:hypothetical protein
MSGVAKDDTNPNSPADDTLPATGETKAAEADAPATLPAAAPKDDAEPRSRRGAPHLRVIIGNDGDDEMPAAPLVHQRIGDAFRASRENAGFTLEQVSRDTRVHISHLRAIEEMTPGLLGAPVYAKGYIKSYARFLGMDEQTTLERFLSECAAILKDPEKPEIAPPATSKARKLPVAVPVLGLLVVGLIAGAAVVLLNGGDKTPVTASNDPASISAVGGPVAEPAAPQLRIVALKRAMLEVRSAKGDKYVHRYYNPGESFIVRVGAGFTVSVEDGAAFEWRLGEQSLGLVQPEGGPVYSQNVDQAAQRQPVLPPPPPVVAPIIEPELMPTPGATSAAPSPAPAETSPAPRPPKPQPQPQPATPPVTVATAPGPVPPAAQPTATPVRDPALDAYPGQ